MNQRNLLKSQIIKAWKRSINTDYRNQRINSERSLQASFWSNLNNLMSKNRRIFIEPVMTLQTKKRKILFPDIVVCNTRQVISVIELKYLPRTQPKYKKDIMNLASIATNRNKISISNVRFRGTEKDSVEYTLSKSIIFVWAGIHAKEKQIKNTLYSTGYRSLKNCYLQLHAETEKNSNPRIYTRK